jgi:hypothetical protein
MPRPPGGTLIFEKEFRSEFLPLAKQMSQVEKEIYNSVLKAMSNARMSAAYWRSQMREIDRLYSKMSTMFSNWAKMNIPGQFKRSLALMTARVRAMKSIINTAKKSLAELLATSASTNIVYGLYSSAAEAFISSALAGRAAINDLFLQTQQALVDEHLINTAVGASFEMGNLRQAKTLLKTIFQSPNWNMIEKNEFIRAGKYRYKPSYYAELVARTKFHQAHSQASLVQAANYETDLVQISSHNTTTPICIPYEGNIYSISGKDERFDPLPDVPPFHPNCLHLMYPTFESGLISQGVLTESGVLA